MNARAGRGRRLAVVALVLLALAGAGAGTTAWLARTYGPRLTREGLEAALGGALGRPVRIQRVSFQPWLGRVRLSGLTVAAGAGRETETILAIRSASIHAALASLWRRELVLSPIVLDDVSVRLSPDGAGGAIVLPQTLPDRVTLGPVTAVVGRVRVSGASVIYANPDAGRELRVDNASLSASLADGGLDVAVSVATLRVTTTAGTELLEQLDADVRLQGDRLTLRRLGTRWQGARLSLQGEAVDLAGEPRLEISVAGDLPLAPLAARFGSAWPMTGTARTHGTVRGALARPDVAATVAVEDLVAGPLSAHGVRARLQWSGETLRLSHVSARMLQGSVEGTLQVAPSRLEETRATVRLAGVAVEELAALAGRPIGVTGRVTAALDLSGDPRSLEAMTVGIRLDSSTLRLPGGAGRLGPVTVSGEGQLAGGILQVIRAEGRASAARAEVAGRIAADGPRGARLLVAADLGELARRWERGGIAGHVTASTEISGPWTAPVATGVARSTAIAARGVRVERVEIPFELREQVLQVRGAEATLGQSRLTVTGRLSGLGPDFGWERLGFAAELRAPAAQIEDLGAWLPEAWKGRGQFGLTARLSGSPRAWIAAGEVRSEALTLRLPARDLQARFATDGQSIEVADLRATVLGVPLRARGRRAPDGALAAEASLGPAPLASVPGLPPRLAPEGRVRAQVSLELVRGQLTAAGTVDAEGLALMGAPLGTGHARLSLRDESIQIEAELPDVRVRGTAHGRVGEREMLRARLSITDHDVGPLLRRVMPAVAGPAGGRISAEAELTVPIAEPAAARGTVRVDPVRLTVASDSWENRRPLVIRREPGVLRLEAARLESPKGTIDVSGSVHDAGPLDLELRGTFPLAALAAFRPEIREVSGALEATVRVGGTWAAPRASGEGAIADGILQLKDWPDTLRDVRARFTVAPGGLRLVSARASLGGGELRASGDLALEPGLGNPFRFAVTARSVAPKLVEGLEARWDADLELVGARERAQLRGEARLLRGTYSRDISLLRLLMQPRRGEVERTEAAPLSLDLRVGLGDGLAVRTTLVRLRAQGSLSVQGTVGAPVVFGSLVAPEGQFVFRRHTFALTSASARFSDPRRIDPVLDVHGTATIRGYDVTIRMSGRSDDLEIRLTSSPPLPEEDVLSLVAFGATREQLGRQGAGAVAGELAGFLIEDLFGSQVGATKLDVLEMETAEAGGRTLKVGKQLTPDVLLLYSQGLEASQERKLRIEYQVIGPFRIAGEQDFRGGFGADVLVRLRFR